MAGRHVLCIGSANIDHVVEVAALPAGPGKQQARGSRWGGGGVAATAAVSVCALGGQATWCGAIGDDRAGRDVAEMLTAAGVVVGDKSVIPGARTAIAAVLVDAAGERWLGWFAGDSVPGSGDLPAQLPAAGSVDAVVADQMAPALAGRAFAEARAAGAPRVLDVEDARMPGTADLAALADNVIYSADGLRSVTGTADVDTALAEAGRRLPHATVAVTLGPAGSAWLARDTSAVVRVPAFPVVARDTTGCGDVFHGSYALALAEGLPPLAAAEFASAVAALKAERGAAWLGMPDRADTEALIRKGHS